jgi:hypothetical protein
MDEILWKNTDREYENRKPTKMGTPHEDKEEKLLTEERQ